MNWKNDDHRLNSSDLEADVSPGHFGFSALLRRAILARQNEKNVSSSGEEWRGDSDSTPAS